MVQTKKLESEKFPKLSALKDVSMSSWPCCISLPWCRTADSSTSLRSITDAENHQGGSGLEQLLSH